MQFLSYLINGISLGSVYALIALGYTMVYGIAKMLNFAHGDVIMIGSYVIFFAFGSFGLNPIVSVLLSMVVCTILGITMERVAYRPLARSPVPGCSDHSHRRFLSAAAGGPAAVDFQPQELQVRCQPAAHQIV